jgi:hypothetical protein
MMKIWMMATMKMTVMAMMMIIIIIMIMIMIMMMMMTFFIHCGGAIWLLLSCRVFYLLCGSLNAATDHCVMPCFEHLPEGSYKKMVEHDVGAGKLEEKTVRQFRNLGQVPDR